MTENLDEERGVSAVGAKKPWLTPGKKALAIGTAMVVVIGFVFWKNPGAKKDDDTPSAPPALMSQRVQYDPPKIQPMPLPVAASAPLPPPVVSPQPQPQPELPQPRPFANPIASAPKEKERPPRMTSYATSIAPSHEAAAQSGDQRENGGTRVTYKGAEIVGAKAGPALDRDLLLMPGLVRCVLDTAIDSTLPGPLMCHLPAPVISDGNVVLMEKDTQIIGQYTNDVKQGQGRLMAVTATAYTPNGVPVPLGGPFADGLGRSGLDGNVDNHIMERFGGAVMLSLAQSALGIAQSSVSKGGNSYVSFSSGGVGSLAQDVLRSTIDIPPTVTKNQGEEVSLWILTPIDFSHAYRLRNR